MGKKLAIVIVIIVVLLLAGGWWYFYGQEDLVEEEREEEVDEETEEERDEETEEERDEAREDDPYHQAETVVPVSDRNMLMDEDLRSIFEEVFGEAPKLTNTAEEGLVLSYVVNRNITPDDVIEVREMLEDRGHHGEYEVVGTDSQENEYELNLAAEIAGEEYGGNIYALFYTDEEGENSQRIEISFL